VVFLATFLTAVLAFLTTFLTTFLTVFLADLTALFFLAAGICLPFSGSATSPKMVGDRAGSLRNTSIKELLLRSVNRANETRLNLIQMYVFKVRFRTGVW